MKQLGDLTVKELKEYCVKTQCNDDGCLYARGSDYKCDFGNFPPSNFDVEEMTKVVRGIDQKELLAIIHKTIKRLDTVRMKILNGEKVSGAEAEKILTSLE